MKLLKSQPFSALFLTFLISVTQPNANAGVYTLTQFVNQGDWSLGLEPEITLTNSGGFAVNAKFTYGLNELSNLQFGIGPGSGAREFRIGGGYTLDFLPDIEGQLGTGLAVQGYVYKLRGSITTTELSLAPYVHKSFKMNNGTAVDPYVALPFGVSLAKGTYDNLICQGVVGSFFKLTPNFSYSLELGINLAASNQFTDSYLSGGVTYTH